MHSRHAFFAATLAAPFLALATWVGCSSSSSPNAAAGDCHATPEQCGAGTTCWPTSDDNGAIAFGCVKSTPGIAFGAPCQFDIGVATCGDLMTCDATKADGSGTCTYYCNQTHACPVAYGCFATHVGGDAGPTINVCRSNASPVGDGSTDPGSSGGVPPGYLPDGGFDPNYDGGAPDGSKPI